MYHMIESLLEAEAAARRLVAEAHQKAAIVLRRAREEAEANLAYATTRDEATAIINRAVDEAQRERDQRLEIAARSLEVELQIGDDIREAVVLAIARRVAGLD